MSNRDFAIPEIEEAADQFNQQMADKSEFGKYKHSNGKMEANIQILEEKPINKGEFGEAYEVKVQVKGGAKGTFVLKK
jgi:hypothetical protein